MDPYFGGDKKKSSQMRFGLGFQQTINRNVSGTIAADVNVSSAFLGNAGGDAHSLGFELKFKD